MKKIYFLLLILILLLLFNNIELAKQVRFNLFSDYSWESLALSRHSLWNPGLVFQPGPKQTISRLSLNPETRLKLGETRWVFSPSLILTGSNKVEFRLRECYFTLGFGDFEISAGKGIVKLGTGYMFTPISIITPKQNISDPEDSRRSTQGVELVKLDYYRENLNLSAMIFKRDTWSNAALFAYCHIAGIDWYGIVYYPDYKKIQWGAAFSTTIGNHMEIHGEWMLHKQSPVDFHKVYFEPNPRVTYMIDPRYNPGQHQYNEYILGVNITVKPFNIIAEYYHKDWGLKPEWYDKLNVYYRFNFETTPDPLQSPDVLSGLSVIEQGMRGLMRDYLFIRAAVVIRKNTDLSGIFFMNLHDFSSVAVLKLEHRLIGGIYLYLRPALFLGKKGSEFNESMYSHSLQLGIRGLF